MNPQHLKSIPGKKTDFKDGERIADLLQHGLLRGSFVPPQAIRELRDLTRMRATLAQERSSVISRIEKTLEDPNLKLGVVVSYVVGVSGRAMLEAIVKGETDAAVLAELAKGTLRNKMPQLKLALEGNLSQHHRFMLRQWLDRLDFLDRKTALLEEQIVEHSRPFEATVVAWMQVPGLRRINASEAEAKVNQQGVHYSGPPQFKPIENTSLQYAANTQAKVIRDGDVYYLCFQGVWFLSTTPNGPWKTADSVPQENLYDPAELPRLQRDLRQPNESYDNDSREHLDSGLFRHVRHRINSRVGNCLWNGYYPL